ncbi:SCL-interrupting locus protein homolog [Brienomyrus brachyistius]|uniref:SCL-interrupting locus protein homolog n=1 Tax=Brienomyrus brachyistius TaxID=42636 RepID=UPI0020B256D7|nr:SCL-interrupting locus protein homolog [Brienomyrus brachyistius]
MSVKVNLKALPPQVLQGVLKNPDPQRMLRSSENVITPFSFPKSKVALWDPAPTGDSVSLHLCYYRNPKIILAEKALRLAYRQARQSCTGIFSCFLLGALTVDDDEEGVTLTLDRFDPGRDQPGSTAKVPTALLPGDVLLPCVIGPQGATSANLLLHSTEDLNVTFKALRHSCCSRDAAELSDLLVPRARLGCSEQLDRLSFSLRWAAVTVADTLDAVPVRPVPIIPTALARNLSGVASVTQPLQAVCRKRGFLTMDQTRKLLLVLESDPKAHSLPLVGVWLSGVTHIHSPQVWAWCLRYLYGAAVQDRVMSEGGAFLVVLYSLTHRNPEFYQCQPCGGQQEMTFQLLTSTESVTLYKHAEMTGRPLQFELSPENVNQESEFFKKVVSSVSFSRSSGGTSSASPQNKLSISDQDSGVEDEDLSPRPSPNPHPLSQQTRSIRPSVPELSLVMDGSFLDGRKLSCREPPHALGPTPSPALQQRGSAAIRGCRSASKPPGLASVLGGPPRLRRPPALGTLPARDQPGPGQQRLRANAGKQPASSSGRSSSGGCPPSPANSASSSSTPSTPMTSGSPDTSASQPRPLAAPPKGLSPFTPQPPLSSPGLPPPLGYHSLRCSTASLSQVPLYPHPSNNMHSTPSSKPSSECVGLPCSCCVRQHGHVSRNTPLSWQTVSPSPAVPRLSSGGAGVVCCPTPDSTPHHECCSSSPRRACCQSSPHHSPACITSSPVHHPSPHEACSPSREHSAPTRWLVEQPAPACQAPCCQAVYPALPPGPPADGATGILPADAYRILVDQDRQLKLLHAQIKKLLEAQGKESSPAAPPSSTERWQEEAKERVSIAVSTGASLYWSPPQGEPESELEAQGEIEVSSAFTLPTPEEHASSSMTSDGPDREDERRQTVGVSSPRSLPADGLHVFQSPVPGESAVLCDQARSPDELGSPPQQASTSEDEQRFYKVLLGQVNSRLQASLGKEEAEQQERAVWTGPPTERHSLSPKEAPPPRSAQLEGRKKTSEPDKPEQDQVLQATLRQLQKLGVTVELDPPRQGKATRSTLESTSTLASISPEAVVPRLTLSESVGTSMWAPSVGGSVDLSLEANAIALKYLSDSHLSRFSLGMRPSVPLQSPGAVHSGNAFTECATTGLSVLSSSNMSFATRKYMKKYGLIEENGSEEEVEMQEEAESTDLRRDSALGHSARTDLSENFSPERGGILKNIGNNQAGSQSQLLRDLRPKMQLLSSGAKKKSQQENDPHERGPQPMWVGAQAPRDPSVAESSVGNFLDLSRLRQLPKLF